VQKVSFKLTLEHIKW